jgi:hypothetical protein
METETVWLLLQEGFNAEEIAAAAKVSVATAHGMIVAATPRPIRTTGQLHLRREGSETGRSSTSMQRQ